MFLKMGKPMASAPDTVVRCCNALLIGAMGLTGSHRVACRLADRRCAGILDINRHKLAVQDECRHIPVVAVAMHRSAWRDARGRRVVTAAEGQALEQPCREPADG